MPGCRSKSPRHLSPSKETWMSVDDWKKARRREQCRINQANFRKRKRERELQAAAGEQSTKSQVEDSKTTTEEEKKARRREKCRVYQVNYWKRKRLHEEQLMRDISELKHELKRLETTKSLTQQQQQEQQEQQQRPKWIQSITDFYRALKEAKEPPVADVDKYQSMHGCTPALEELLDLQREEFDSVESLRLHWLWYRTQFKDFALSIKSCERLKTSGGAVVKVTGALRLGVKKEGESNATYDMIVCPVLQQFEVESGEKTVSRITSEVGLVEGAIATLGQSGLELALLVLKTLSEKFSRTPAYDSVDN
ncbi:hypothetical protein PHYBOEH_000562 [Phytophthora boehmeriae]|uniref:Bzip transcription factor n=1 Tax=Phytophthora boehmeriae TaxID=109152 RepID=A0A8T1VEJ5_9STRA|nr:hypothetical protein PHYBOEH_000562 [Phytophthora boehmeriae]